MSEEQEGKIPAWLGNRYAHDDIEPAWSEGAVLEVLGGSGKAGTDPVDAPAVRSWLLGLSPQALLVELTVSSLRNGLKLQQAEKQIHFCSQRFETTGNLWHEVASRQYWRNKAQFELADANGSLAEMEAARANWRKHRSDTICLNWSNTCLGAIWKSLALKLCYNV